MGAIVFLLALAALAGSRGGGAARRRGFSPADPEGINRYRGHAWRVSATPDGIALDMLLVFPDGSCTVTRVGTYATAQAAQGAARGAIDAMWEGDPVTANRLARCSWPT